MFYLLVFAIACISLETGVLIWICASLVMDECKDGKPNIIVAILGVMFVAAEIAKIVFTIKAIAPLAAQYL